MISIHVSSLNNLSSILSPTSCLYLTSTRPSKNRKKITVLVPSPASATYHQKKKAAVTTTKPSHNLPPSPQQKKKGVAWCLLICMIWHANNLQKKKLPCDESVSFGEKKEQHILETPAIRTQDPHFPSPALKVPTCQDGEVGGEDEVRLFRWCFGVTFSSEVYKGMG